MDSPTPWRTGTETPDADTRQLLDDARRLKDWPGSRQEQVWARIEEEARGGGARRRWAFALAAPALAAMAALVVMLRAPAPATGWRELDLGVAGRLELGPSAVVTDSGEPAAGERRIALDSGELRAQIAKRSPERPLVVVTPQLRVVVVGTRFTVLVERTLTTVTVDEGRVRVEAPSGRKVLVEAGQKVRSDDARLAVPQPTGCGAEPTVAQRKACYEREASGSGLAAQNAVYALAVIARDEERDEQRALAYWTEYDRRFPNGALAPEAVLALMQAYAAQERNAEALAQADAFQARFSGDARAFEVAVVRAGLLCRLGRTREAVAAYEAVGPDAPTRSRDDALYERAACERAAGLVEESRATAKRYQQQFPEGSHRGQIDELLRR